MIVDDQDNTTCTKNKSASMQEMMKPLVLVTVLVMTQCRTNEDTGRTNGDTGKNNEDTGRLPCHSLCSCSLLHNSITCRVTAPTSQGIRTIFHNKWSSLVMQGSSSRATRNKTTSIHNQKYQHTPEGFTRQLLEEQLFENQTILQRLELSNLGITEIAPNTFHLLRSLSALNVSHNNITKLPHCIFCNLKNLRELDLSFNGLRNIPQVFKSSLPLTYLSLAANSINSTALNSFGGLHLLETLILDQNDLRTLQVNTFQGLTHLKALSLKSCSLHDANFITTLPSWNYGLCELTLQDNALETIDWETLGQMPHLKTIDISHNRVQHFNDLTSMQHFFVDNLNLAFNEITVFPSFAKCCLKTLNLEGNTIKRLPANWSSDSLQFVSLANNYLEDPVSIGNLPLLSELDLSSNKLTQIPEMSNLTAIGTIDLSHNSMRFEWLMMSEEILWEQLGICAFQGVSMTCECRLLGLISLLRNNSNLCLQESADDNRHHTDTWNRQCTQRLLFRVPFKTTVLLLPIEPTDVIAVLVNIHKNCNNTNAVHFAGDHEYLIMYTICGTLTCIMILVIGYNFRSSNSQHYEVRVVVFNSSLHNV